MKSLSHRRQERKDEFWMARKASIQPGLKVLPLDEMALKKRIELNQKISYLPPEHPFEWDIPEWTLSTEHSQAEEIVKEKSFEYIDKLESFERLVVYLKKQLVFALDLEFSGDNSFHTITSLIQISTAKHDFIVDSIVLHSHVNTLLYDVMIDKCILKIFYGSQDVLALQRDFDMRVFPLIDFQNVYQMHKQMDELPGFKYVVGDILSHSEKVDVDKKWQCFNWRLRPLPKEAVNYARYDSNLLLACWEKFKLNYATFIISNNFPYKHQRNVMLKSYKFPSKKDYNHYFRRAWEQAPEQIKKLFQPNDTDIFREIQNWRYNTARSKDANMYNVVSDLDILKIAVLKPKNISVFNEISCKVQRLNYDEKLSILSFISRKRH